MTAVRLAEMTDAEFGQRRAELLRDTAISFAANRGLTPAEAREVARRELAAGLPQGRHTPGHLLRQAVAGERVVGWIWLSLPGTAMPAMAWVSDVEVDEPHRSRGLGRAVMLAGEDELIRRGVRRVGLNVNGGNDHALRLYQKLGYRVIRQQRARAVRDVPIAPESPVDLVPMKPAEFERRHTDLIRRQAEHRRQAEDLAPGAALLISTAAVDALLPHGPLTDGALVFTALVDGREAGWVWAARPAPPRPGMGWLHDVVVDGGFRGRGHGRAIVGRVEGLLARYGVRTLGLHVRGDDPAGLRLFEALGFEVLSQQMVKDLPAD